MFLTKLDIVVHCCELECHAEKKRKKEEEKKGEKKRGKKRRVLSVKSSRSITTHTVSYGGIYSVCTKRQCLGREGRPGQIKQGAGKRQRGAGPGGKGWSYLHTSRVPD